MRIQELVKESLVGKQVEFNAQELIVLSTFVETIKEVITPDDKVKPFVKHDQAVEILQKVIVLLTPIIDGVEGLEATAKELFTAPKEKEYKFAEVPQEVDEEETPGIYRSYTK